MKEKLRGKKKGKKRRMVRSKGRRKWMIEDKDVGGMVRQAT